MDDRVIQKAKPAAPAPAAPQQRFAALRCAEKFRDGKRLFYGLLCIAICGGIWWFLTRGEIVEDRILSSAYLPKPPETFDEFSQSVVSNVF